MDKLKPFITTLSKNPIIQILKKFGNVYLVGGAIRSILGDETPNDIDLFLTTDPEEVIHIIDNLKSAEFTVQYEIKRNYEGWTTKDLVMIYPRSKNGETYDVVIGSKLNKHTHDFDVNSMFVDVGSPKDGNSIMYIKDGNFVPIIGEELIQMKKNITAKQMNFATTVEYLKANNGTIHGDGQMAKRSMKRLNYGWNLVQSSENTKVVEYLLNHVHPGLYTQQKFKRECKLLIANLMKYMMEVGYDLNTFVHQSDSEFSTKWQTENYKNVKVLYFTEMLNTVANKCTKMFDMELCKKIMTYCGLTYEVWENHHEYMGVYSQLESKKPESNDDDE